MGSSKALCSVVHFTGKPLPSHDAARGFSLSTTNFVGVELWRPLGPCSIPKPLHRDGWGTPPSANPAASALPIPKPAQDGSDTQLQCPGRTLHGC